MLRRRWIGSCLSGAILVLLAWPQTAPAQDEKPPLDRPAAEPRGDFDDFRGPFDRPPPKDPLRKPRLGPDGQGPGDFPGPKPPPRDDGFPPSRDGRPPGPPQGLGPAGGLRGDGMHAGPPKVPQGAVGFDPEMYQLDQADLELARKTMDAALRYRHATAENREQLKEELADLVSRHFDVRQERRELQLKRLEEELQRLRESIQARNEAREQIVNKRIAELLGERDDLSF